MPPVEVRFEPRDLKKPLCWRPAVAPLAVELVRRSDLPVPDMQYRMLEIKRSTTAVHIHPNAFGPTLDGWPFDEKLLRPLTYPALLLQNVNIRHQEKRDI